VKDNKDLNHGFNAGIWVYGDMVAMWIIDPAKVERVALENAVSAAAMVLTTECVVAELSTPDTPTVPTSWGMWGMWWMPGMY